MYCLCIFGTKREKERKKKRKEERYRGRERERERVACRSVIMNPWFDCCQRLKISVALRGRGDCCERSDISGSPFAVGATAHGQPRATPTWGNAPSGRGDVGATLLVAWVLYFFEILSSPLSIPANLTLFPIHDSPRSKEKVTPATSKSNERCVNI